ncbi:hypothetical protein GQX73_g7356 [Xylaria multiplex]|uniref:Rhodopsin domain-containing protein n=1 Tax=Xylaria multiplex TaxID=323545 RepID=A0A7C8IQ62_9PEZI|nr:hypothetical protein GQX73_g7356 [Xylaria multiplex]
MTISFSSLSAAQQQALLDGPALEPPPNVSSNFDNPSNLNTAGYVVPSIALAITTIFVFIRLYTRFFIVRRARLEDYLILAGYGIYVGTTYAVFRLVTNVGFFVHQWDIRFRDLSEYLYAIHICANLYSVHILVSKAAILLEWLHIFVPGGTRNAFFWACHILLWVNVLFYFSIIIVANLVCFPFALIWDKTLEGTCIDGKVIEVTSAVLNLTSDVIILVLPQRVIWNLQMKMQKKIGFSVIFAIGILAVTAAAFRLSSATDYYHSKDATYVASALILWSLVEMTSLFLILSVPSVPKALQALKKTLVPTKATIASWPRPRIFSDPTRRTTNTGDYREMSDGDITLSQSRPYATTDTLSQSDDGQHGIVRTSEVTSKTERNTEAIKASQFKKIHPWYLLVSTYRLLLHPLRSYPGPVLAKVSDVYSGFYSLKRGLHLKTYEDHQTYGRVIRHGPNKLVFNSATALHDIYLNENISKSLCYQAGNVNPSTTNVFNTIDKRVHRLKRKLVGQIVTERSIRAFEPILSEQVDIFVKQLAVSYHAEPDVPVNMSERSKYLGLDISGYLGFGYALNLQTSHIHRYLVRAMMIGSWRLNMYMQFPALRKLKLEILFYALALIQGKSFLQTLSKMIQARLAKDKNAEHDLYSFMVDALEAPEEERITASEIWTEGIFFLPAAGDTTSTALSSLFFYLAKNPECQEKVANEVRSAFKTSAEIGGSRLSACSYLRACINEALRMSPPVAGTLWRELLPINGGEPLVVDGHPIPPGTQVGVNTYALHHNPEYFPDPFTYNPDRWFLEEGGARVYDERGSFILINHAAFTPFSHGSRGCAGKALAYAEVSLAIARTLWYFDFKFPSTPQKPQDHPSEFELRDVFTSAHDGPHLIFQPRGEFWREHVD